MAQEIVRIIPQRQQSFEKRCGREPLLFVHLEKVANQGDLTQFPHGNWWLGCERPANMGFTLVEWFWVGPAIESFGCPISRIVQSSREEIWEAIKAHNRRDKTPEQEEIISSMQAVCRHRLLYGKQVGLKYAPEYQQQAFMIGRAIRYFYNFC